MSDQKDPPLFGGIQIEKQKKPISRRSCRSEDLGSRKRIKRPT